MKVELTPEQWQLVGYQALSLGGFISLNIALNFFNSWALKKNSGGPEFDFPVFYTMTHMVATMLGSGVIMSMKKPLTGYPSFGQLKEYSLGLFPIAICTTANLACNNVSLTLVSLFLNQVIKAAAPLPTMLFSFILERKTYTLKMVVTCTMIVVGTVLAIPMSSKGGTTSLVGVIIVIISMLAASLKPVVMTLVFKGMSDKPKLDPPVVLFYDSFLSFWIMLMYWLISPTERAGTIEYIGKRSSTAILVICAGASMAFFFNLCTYFVIKYTSAVTCMVASNGNKVINIVISGIIANAMKDARNLCGVVLVCLSIAAYAYASHDAKKNPPKPFFKKDVETGGKASEATPLAPSPDTGRCCVIC
ncbi:hypothetical protein AB1Y20_009217 [Prymnesium parvum]|uniref:Sugar phosphate transporter domain-containing protein n=1 Tax=Prymnesium parvum TaxID=97485 RepID=A0AB34K3Y6_PRYPA